MLNKGVSPRKLRLKKFIWVSLGVIFLVWALLDYCRATQPRALVSWDPNAEYAAALLFIFQRGIEPNILDDANPVRLTSHLFWAGKDEETYSYLTPELPAFHELAPEFASYENFLQFVVLLKPTAVSLLSSLRAVNWAYQNFTAKREREGPSRLQLLSVALAVTLWYRETGYHHFLKKQEDAYSRSVKWVSEILTSDKFVTFLSTHRLNASRLRFVVSLVIGGGYSFALVDGKQNLVILGPYEGLTVEDWFPASYVQSIAIHEVTHHSVKDLDLKSLTVPSRFIDPSAISRAGYNADNQQGVLSEGLARAVEGLFILEMQPQSKWEEFVDQQVRDGFYFVPIWVTKVWDALKTKWELKTLVSIFSSIAWEKEELPPTSATEVSSQRQGNPNLIDFMESLRTIRKLKVWSANKVSEGQVKTYLSELSSLLKEWRGHDIEAVETELVTSVEPDWERVDKDSAWLLLMGGAISNELVLNEELPIEVADNSLELLGIPVERGDWWLSVVDPIDGSRNVLMLLNYQNCGTFEMLTPEERWTMGTPDLPIASGGGD